MKLAVAAAVASILTRSGRFQRILMRDERTMVQRLQFALGCSAIFAAGVAARVLTHNTYQAVDLGLEGAMVMGMLGGYVTGLSSGILISLPAMINDELMSMPLFAAVGVLGGLLRDVAPSPDDIWRFTPFFDLSLYRLVFKRQLKQAAFSLACVLTILVAEILRFSVLRVFPKNGVFALYQNWEIHWVTVLAVSLTTLFTVALPLKVWNNTRNERKLETQQLLLNEARLAALTRQINPHFLFNTLNSVASLIRVNPDQARAMVYRLSNILRRLLRQHDNLNPLRDELSFIDDYLAIEMVRFGDKLKFVKEVEPNTLDRLVPSMLLQPLIENSIRHGLSSKVDGGTIRIRIRTAEGRLHVLVEDDGVGIPESKLATLFESGIGVSNVNERLKVLFGDRYRMWIDSKPGEGTCTGIEIPDQAASLPAAS